MSDQPEQIFARALELHQSGQVSQAENLYHQVLAIVPNHLDSLNLLGVAAIQTGRHHLAIELLGKAIALNARISDFHNNIGQAFRHLGRIERAIDHFTRAVGLEPTFTQAHQNLADALKAQGKFDQATSIYLHILERKPDFAAAHTGLGQILRREGRLDEAVAHLRQVVALSPGSADAHNDLGIAFREQGKLCDAVKQFQRAVSLRSDFVEAHGNLGNALREHGQLDRAVAQLRRALDLKPDFAPALHNLALVSLARGAHNQALEFATSAVELDDTQPNRALFVRCLRAQQSLTESSVRRPLVLRALSDPWARPGELMRPITSLIKASGAVKRLMTRVATLRSGRASRDALFEDPDFKTLKTDELLLRLLESAPIADLDLERLLTLLRSALLDAATEMSERILSELAIRFFCALAHQCFINDYVFIHADTEYERTRTLHNSIDAALHARKSIPVLGLVAAACYAPLHSLSRADLLLGMTWPAPVNELLAQQVREPAAIRQYRASIPRLTAISDRVSLSVRQQYEESPYPSWVKLCPTDDWPSIDVYLRNWFPLAAFVGLDKRDHDILIAGCGTGQQAIETAQRFPRARVLAVDLSIASLAYARAKTRAANVSNIEYAQADILELGTIARTFDVVEATGVLHHLSDPMNGWRILLSLLRPGGFMRLGLYSNQARQAVQAARTLISQRGYRATPEDIRRCRQEMMNFDEGSAIHRLCSSPDFASTSACRDLLFHVHECPLTLPEIERFVTDNGLRFLGFELEPQVLEAYRARFPQDVGATKLDLWHLFESENPHTFGEMYQFWIQKPQQ